VVDMHHEIDFLSSLLFTITIETMVIYGLIRYFYKKEIETKEILFAGVLPSFATLPYVWFIFPLLFVIGSYALYVWTAEISVTLIEVLILYKLLNISLKEAFVLSFFANLASYGIGKIIHILM